jgi:hypothetical protein
MCDDIEESGEYNNTIIGRAFCTKLLPHHRDLVDWGLSALLTSIP